jgi:hypothetical protein
MIGRTAVMVVLAALGLAGSAAADGASARASAPVPTPIGVGPRFQPSAVGPGVRAGRAVGNLRCAGIVHLQRAHIELFAQRRVVIVPAGIGVSRARACTYPVRTVDPTGVVEFDAAKLLTVGTLFRVWGRRLAPDRLLSFTGHVRAYVGGKRWHGRVPAIPLGRHAEIVLEVGPYVPPHAKYLFGPGR